MKTNKNFLKKLTAGILGFVMTLGVGAAGYAGTASDANAETNYKITKITSTADFKDGAIILVTQGSYYLDASQAATSNTPKMASLTLKDGVPSGVSVDSAFDVKTSGAGLRLYKHGDSNNYLYTNTSNNGARIGSGSTSGSLWTIQDCSTTDHTFYLKSNASTARYLSRYSTTDFRSYTNTNTNANLTLYKYEEDTAGTYNVIYNSCISGVDSVTRQVAVGTAATTIDNPFGTQDGKRFKGWNTGAGGSGGTHFDAGVTYTGSGSFAKDSNNNLYAEWETIVTYKVSFMDDSSELFYQNVEAGQKATRPGTNPTKAGYRFDNWYTTNGGSTLFDFNTTINSATSVYAKFIEQVTVTFDANFEGSTYSESKTLDINTALTDMPANPTREDYIFKGWYTTSACTTEFDFTQVSASTTVYAKWAEDTSIEVVLGDGTYTAASGDVKGYITWTVMKNTAVLATITQTQGSNTSNAVNSSYIASPRIYQNHILTFTATPGYKIEQIQISYSGSNTGKTLVGGTSVGSDNVVVSDTTNINIVSPETTGTHVISSKNQNGLTTIYIQMGSQLRPSGIKVSLINEVKEKHSVIYSKGSASDVTGDVPSSFELEEGAQGTLAAATSFTLNRPNYDMIGLSTTENDTEVKYNFGAIITMGTSNITLYPVWAESVQKVNVIYNNGESGEDEVEVTDKVQVGSDYSLLSGAALGEGFTKVGWTITKWKDSSNNEYDVGKKFEDIDAGLSLVAIWTKNTHSLKFYREDQGQLISEATVEYGATIIPPTVTKDGYTFSAWNATVPSTMPDEDLSFYATWGIVNYSITYHLDGGTNSSDNPSTYNVESDTFSFKKATKDGYIFAGWFDSTTGGNKVVSVEKGSFGNIDLYARWETYIPYDLITSVDYLKAGMQIVITSAEKNVVAGAYNDEKHNLTDAEATFSNGEITSMNGDAMILTLGKLNEKWTLQNSDGQYLTCGSNKSVIFYDKLVTDNTDRTAAGTWTISIGSETVSSTTKEDVASISSVGCSGSRFLHNVSSGMFTTYSSDPSATMIIPQIYAKECQVTYDANGATSGTVPTDANAYKHGSSNATALGNTGSLVKTGYDFAGWNTKADGTGTTYAAGSNITLNSSITLYAKWTETEYSLTLDGELFGNYTAGTEVVLPGKTTTGYTFQYWVCGTDYYNEGDKFTMPSANVSMTSYNTANTYTYKYILDNGSADIVDNLPYSTTPITLRDAPEFEGHKFKGWLCNKDSATYGAKGSYTMVAANDVTFTAQWEIEEYLVCFDVNGGTPVSADFEDTVVAEYNSTISNPGTLQKARSQFAGWAIEGSDPLEYWDFENGKVKGEMTLVAQWNEISTYTVSFNANGHGENPLDQYVAPGEHASVPTAPTAPGYEVTGWYRNSECTGNAFDFENEVIESDLTLYAKWQNATYNIYYKEVNETPIASDTYVFGTGKALITPESKVGYNFAGWYSDKALSVEITSISNNDYGDKTLYAKWTLDVDGIQTDINNVKTDIGLAFQYSVNDSQSISSKTVGEVTYHYEKVVTAPTDWSGEYLVVCEEDDLSIAWTGVDAASCKVDVSISNNTISSVPSDAAIIEIEKYESGYSIKVGDNYISGTSNNKGPSNGIAYSDDPYACTLELATKENSSGDTYQYTKIISDTSTIMAYNKATNNERFRFFKSDTASGTGYPGVQLYKKVADTPTPPPGPTYDSDFRFNMKNTGLNAFVEKYSSMVSDYGIVVEYGERTRYFSYADMLVHEDKRDDISFTLNKDGSFTMKLGNILENREHGRVEFTVYAYAVVGGQTFTTKETAAVTYSVESWLIEYYKQPKYQAAMKEIYEIFFPPAQ